MNILQDVSPDAAHPFTKDADGGASYGGSTELNYRFTTPTSMTASERIMHGRATAEDYAEIERTNAKHIAWKKTPEAAEFYKKYGINK